MAKILISEFINKDSLNKLKRFFKVHYDENLWKYPKKIARIINDFDCLIVRNKTIVNKNLLNEANKIQLVGRLGVGMDNIDTEYCYSKKIRIQPATGMNADSVAEYVGACSLFLIKKITLFHKETLKGNWPRTIINSEELKNKKVGIIGYGVVGKRVSEYFAKIGLKVIVHDRYIKNVKQKNKFHFSSLSFLLKNSNIISLHVPLTAESKNLINKNSFIKMKKKPIIINTSRGSIVNESDLVDAYNKNLISGFALDVFKNEPVQKNFLKKIKKNMNCILTPHISGVTYQSNIRVSNFIVDKVIDYFN